MAASHIGGPSVASPISRSPENGPSVSYQGHSLVDPRQRYHPGMTGVGHVPALPLVSQVETIRATPSAAGAAKVVAAATATSGTAMTLVSTVTASAAPNAPFLPIGASSSSGIIKALAIEPGFTVASTTSGSAAFTVSAIAQFPFLVAGVKLAVAGGTGGTWVLGTVISVSGTTVTLDTVMGVTSSTVPIALANGTGRAADAPLYIDAFRAAGAMRGFEATQGVSRGVSVTSNNAGDTGWTMTVAGYDIYGAAMSEAIAVTANSVAYGKKGFKFVKSCTPTKGGGGSSTGTLSVGTSDVIGLPLRSDYFEDTLIHWNAALLTANTGWLVADTTATATTTTGDVRGTFQLGTAGGGTGVTGSTDGTKRLVVRQFVPTAGLYAATLDSQTSLFGVTQA
jgi:hypothetical protein